MTTQILSKHYSSIVFSLLLIVLANLACTLGEVENKTPILDQYYIIDSRTILDSLAHGRKDVFSATNAPPPSIPSPNIDLVSWRQAEYLQIAESLNEHVWGESLAGWNLFYMDFSLDCDEVGNGFQYAALKYFQIVNTGKRETRITHNMTIDPKNNFVSVWETDYYPNLEHWKYINLAEMKISAYGALQIAEKNGGYEKRTAAGNVCNISVAISRASVLYEGWTVIYSPGIFIDEIDPVTGK